MGWLLCASLMQLTSQHEEANLWPFWSGACTRQPVEEVDDEHDAGMVRAMREDGYA